MSRLVHLCAESLPPFLAAFPFFGLLLAAREPDDCIASEIPGLGVCRSTYCKPVRVIAR